MFKFGPKLQVRGTQWESGSPVVIYETRLLNISGIGFYYVLINICFVFSLTMIIIGRKAQLLPCLRWWLNINRHQYKGKSEIHITWFNPTTNKYNYQARIYTNKRCVHPINIMNVISCHSWSIIYPILSLLKNITEFNIHSIVQSQMGWSRESVVDQSNMERLP